MATDLPYLKSLRSRRPHTSNTTPIVISSWLARVQPAEILPTFSYVLPHIRQPENPKSANPLPSKVKAKADFFIWSLGRGRLDLESQSDNGIFAGRVSEEFIESVLKPFPVLGIALEKLRWAGHIAAPFWQQILICEGHNRTRVALRAFRFYKGDVARFNEHALFSGHGATLAVRIASFSNAS